MPKITLIRLMALCGIVLMLGVAFCLFDGDDELNSDLCLVSLAISTGALSMSFLARAGCLVPGPAEIYRPLLADLSSPPPRV